MAAPKAQDVSSNYSAIIPTVLNYPSKWRSNRNREYPTSEEIPTTIGVSVSTSPLADNNKKTVFYVSSKHYLIINQIKIFSKNLCIVFSKENLKESNYQHKKEIA